MNEIHVFEKFRGYLVRIPLDAKLTNFKLTQSKSQTMIKGWQSNEKRN